MGFFDEFTDFVKEVKTIGNELTTVSHGVVKELKTEATDIKQTLVDTGDDISKTAAGVKGEWKNSLNSPSPLQDPKQD